MTVQRPPVGSLDRAANARPHRMRSRFGANATALERLARRLEQLAEKLHPLHPLQQTQRAAWSDDDLGADPGKPSTSGA